MWHGKVKNNLKTWQRNTKLRALSCYWLAIYNQTQDIKEKIASQLPIRWCIYEMMKVRWQGFWFITLSSACLLFTRRENTQSNVCCRWCGRVAGRDSCNRNILVSMTCKLESCKLMWENLMLFAFKIKVLIKTNTHHFVFFKVRRLDAN